MKKVFRNSSYDIYNVAKLDSQRNSLKPSSGYTCWEKLFDTLYLDEILGSSKSMNNFVYKI